MVLCLEIWHHVCVSSPFLACILSGMPNSASKWKSHKAYVNIVILNVLPKHAVGRQSVSTENPTTLNLQVCWLRTLQHQLSQYDPLNGYVRTNRWFSMKSVCISTQKLNYIWPFIVLINRDSNKISPKTNCPVYHVTLNQPWQNTLARQRPSPGSTQAIWPMQQIATSPPIMSLTWLS